MVLSLAGFELIVLFGSLAFSTTFGQPQQSNKYVYAEYSGNSLKSLSNDKSFSSDSSIGWELQAFQSSSGGQTMYWESCDAHIESHDSFLTTPLIQKNDASANLQIKISFLVWCNSPSANCNDKKLRGQIFLTGKQVKSFDISISQAHTGSVMSTRPPFPPYSTVIPIDSDVQAFKIRFSDKGLCIRISEIQIYSLYCPSEVRDLAYYPRTFAPQAPDKPLHVAGKCVANSMPDPVSHLPSSSQNCASFGVWTDSFSICLCNPGFHANSNRTACLLCEPHTFKSEHGNALECDKCPANSDSLVRGADRCPCRPGFFRNIETESEAMPCAVSPSAPRDLTYEGEFTSVVLKWKPPEFNGGRDVIWYKVQCPSCEDYFVEDNIRQPILTLANLSPGTQYEVFVYSLNSVSKFFNNRNFSKITVKTRDAILPYDISIAQINPGEVRLFWKSPDNFGGNTYCVRITAPGLADPTEPRCVNGTELLLGNLVPGTYAFEVGAVVTTDLPIIFTKKQFAQVSEMGEMVEVTQKQLFIVVGMMSVICFLFILLCSCAVFMYRRQQTSQHLNNPYESSIKQFSHNPQPTIVTSYSCSSPSNPLLQLGLDGSTLVDGRTMPIGQGFIDPAFYEDLKQMVSEFCQFLDPNDIQVEEQLPKEFLSTFGEISYGLLNSSFSKHSYQNMSGNFGSSDSYMPVFIKSVPVSIPELRRFAIEASTMSQFRHPNVQLIYGISCIETTWNLISEITESGNLALYMGTTYTMSQNPSEEKPKPREMLTQFVHFLRGIASGMQYLSDVGYVHKVLTSSNVRINGNLVCKISGFDHRVTLEECPSVSDEWQKLMDFLTPWCAPEVLQSGKYSSASDVWSLGVIGWELMNCLSLSIMASTSCDNSTNAPRNQCLTSSQNKSSTETDQLYSTLAQNASSSQHSEHLENGKDHQTSTSHENISFLVPYADMTQQRICEFLSNGQRLPIPVKCPQYLGTLISECWLTDRNVRPMFGQVKESLEYFMRQPRLWDTPFVDTSIPRSKSAISELLLNEDKYTTLTNYPPTYIGNLPKFCGSSLLCTVDQWLIQQNMGVYRHLFASNHITELSDLLSLDTSQLKKIGVDSKKDRRVIMNSIQLLKDRLLSEQRNTQTDWRGETTLGTQCVESHLSLGGTAAIQII